METVGTIKGKKSPLVEGKYMQNYILDVTEISYNLNMITDEIIRSLSDDVWTLLTGPN